MNPTSGGKPMQKIGRKSLWGWIEIPNKKNPSTPYLIRVQGNRNHGICDIVQGTKIPQEVFDQKTRKKKTVKKFFPVRRMTEVLSTFQGRQYDDPNVGADLKCVIDNILNNHE